MKPVRTEAASKAALARVGARTGSPKKPPHAGDLVVLVILIEKYGKEHVLFEPRQWPRF